MASTQHLSYPAPANEEERLRELYAYELIGTGKNDQVDRICALTQDIFKVPVALVTLLDRDEQSFLSSCGLAGEGTSRRDAFCNYTILSDDVFIVNDATKDPRFATNPLVTGAPGIRFYAGAPLTVSEGISLGSLCVIDFAPRHFTEAEAAHLLLLAGMVINELRGRRAGLDLMRRKKLLRQTAHMAKIGGWEVSYPSGKMTWDEEVYRIFQIPQTTPADAEHILRLCGPDMREKRRHLLDALKTRGVGFDLEVASTRENGETFWIRSLAEAEMVDGKVTHIFGCVQDITERKNAEARIYELAYRDLLTKLPNRALFQDRLQEAIATNETEGTRFGLLFFDLDHFKDVNDSLGHDAGDVVLRSAAETLHRAFRPADTVARLGGDEFAVLVTDPQSLVEIETLAAAVIALLKEPIQHKEVSLTMGASIGIAVFPDHATNATDILKSADIALYRAKAKGRGCAVLFVPQMREDIDAHLKLMREVRSGIDNGEFVLYYQPIVELRTGEVSGFESLMRWNHPQRGILAPAHFMAAFDDPDLGIDLGEVAIDTALNQMRIWIGAGLEFGRISVNLSAAQFRLPDLAARIAGKLKRAGVPPERLTLEVTESVYMGWGAGLVADTVRSLHQTGITIALDDFGTGYASLSHLRQFPIDRLKIDKSFVQSHDSTAIVDAVINMGLSLGMEIVAEGVEESDQLTLLRMKGCNYVQGYVYSKPMPESRVAAYLGTFAQPEHVVKVA